MAAKDYLPQVALLDIELAADDSFNGIHVAQILDEVSPDTICVFLTGYDKYALDAYSGHPYDYILKPIDEEKVINLITKIISKRDKNITKIAFKSKEGIIFLESESIACIERQNKTSIIYAEQDSYEINHNLTELESILPDQFIRIHNL